MYIKLNHILLGTVVGVLLIGAACSPKTPVESKPIDIPVTLMQEIVEASAEIEGDKEDRFIRIEPDGPEATAKRKHVYVLMYKNKVIAYINTEDGQIVSITTP